MGRVVAVVAFASAILLLAALFYSSSKLNQQTNDTVDGLFVIHDHKGPVFVTTALQALSTALLAVPLWYLYEATRFRRPEVPPVARYLAIAAPPLHAILALARQVQVAHVADKVHAHLLANSMPPDAANHYAKDQLSAGAAQVVGGLGLAAGIALAFAFVLVALNAMRAGLLSRFMGILGIGVGVLFVLPLLGSVPIVEMFWVAAVGLLALGRWPQQGRGPAWETGEAIPWPTAQQRAEEMAARREAREDDDGAEPVAAHRTPAAATVGNGDGEAGHPVPSHPRSKKRKRKRR